MKMRPRFHQWLSQLKTLSNDIQRKYPTASHFSRVLGGVFSIILLYIFLVVSYSTWYPGQILWMAKKEHLSGLNFRLSDYQSVWNNYTKKASSNLPAPDAAENSSPEHVVRRTVLVDFSKDSLYLDLSIWIDKDSDLAKRIVDRSYSSINTDLYKPYFGEIIWDSTEIRFDYDAVTWELDNQTNELVLHLQQKFSFPCYLCSFTLNLPENPIPETDTLTIYLADGFRLAEITPFPNKATPNQIELTSTDTQRLKTVYFIVEGKPSNISTASDNEWAILVSGFFQSLNFLYKIPFSRTVKGIFYVFPLLTFLFWPRQDNSLAFTSHLLKVTKILLIFYFCVSILDEVTYSMGSMNNLLDLPSAFFNILFWNTDFWENLLSSIRLEFKSAAFSLTPIMMGLVVPAAILGRIGELTNPSNNFLKRLLFYGRITAIVFLSFPLFYSFARSIDARFFSAGDLALVIMYIISILMFLSAYWLYYLLSGQRSIDIPLLIVFLVTHDIVDDLLFFGYLDGGITWKIHDVLFFATRLWDKVDDYIYLFLFVHAFLSMLVFAFSETNWNPISTLRGNLKLRLMISFILTVLGTFGYSVGISSSGSLENRPYANLIGGLANVLLNGLPYMWSILILVYVSIRGNKTTKVDPEVQLMGVIAGGGIILALSVNTFPIKFIVGVVTLLYISRRSKNWWEEADRSHQGYFQDQNKWIEKAVNFIHIEKAYREFRKKHYEKLVDNSINAKRYEKDILMRKKEVEALKDHDFGGKSPRDILFSFGPYQSAFENAKHGAIWSVVLAIPWMILFLPDLVSSWGYPTFDALGDILWNVGSNSLQLVFEWAVYGFLFGYFYCYWRGNNGLTKAFWFFCALIIPYFISTGLYILENLDQITFDYSFWASVLFTPMQLLLHCLLLGVIVFEYLPIRRQGHDFQTLLEINGMANFGISVSSIAITFISALISLLTTQTVELLKYALPTLFGGSGTPPLP